MFIFIMYGTLIMNQTNFVMFTPLVLFIRPAEKHHFKAKKPPRINNPKFQASVWIVIDVRLESLI